MSYSKNLRKNVVVVGAAIASGVVIGAAVHAVGTHINGTDGGEKLVQIIRQDDTKISVYGAYSDLNVEFDGNTYNVHISPENQ